MHKKPKPAARITIAFECPACGAQHLLKWQREDVDLQWRIIMECDSCEAQTSAYMTRIGRDTWAAAW